MTWKRYAIYWLPDGALGALGAAWLGWDARTGQAGTPMVDAPKAQSYGFHATLKPPFRLAAGTDAAELAARLLDVAAGLTPVQLGALSVEMLGSFAALRPEATEGIGQVAKRFVEALDSFRAPASTADLARRRASGLTAAQEANLMAWGYPFVMGEFRPHLTLSGNGADDDLVARARAHFSAVTGKPVELKAVSLVGQAEDGRFHLIEDLPLGHSARS